MKTITYILTHNSPRQLLASLHSIRIADADFFTRGELIVVDQSTEPEAKRRNGLVAEMYDVKRVSHDNLGASGGRWLCAKLFHETDSDSMFFFEDDLLLNNSVREHCRFGFPSTVPGIHGVSCEILESGALDYLKLTFHELYFDHSRNFLTQRPAAFEMMGSARGAGYLVGDVYYSNWPMLIRKKASMSIFCGRPATEGEICSRVHQMIVRKEIRVGVLAAYPIIHTRLEDRPDRKDL